MRRRNSVHPRACGERLFLPLVELVGGGSSPRVRGTLSAFAGPRGHKRFIPARAGNASWSPIPRCAPPVHTRACGERSEVSKEELNEDGSSPRVRGTPPRERVYNA